MAKLHDLEAERRAWEPRNMARAALARACDALKEMAVMDSPLAELHTGRDAITRAIEGVAATG
jgi:hypothetical protein